MFDMSLTGNLECSLQYAFHTAFGIVGVHETLNVLSTKVKMRLHNLTHAGVHALGLFHSPAPAASKIPPSCSCWLPVNLSSEYACFLVGTLASLISPTHKSV